MIRPTVRAFLEALAAEQSLPQPNDADVRFVLAQIANLPALLRAPMQVAIAGFALSPFATAGRPFALLPVESRCRVVSQWKRSPIGPCRDLIRFLSSLGMVTLYSRIA